MFFPHVTFKRMFGARFGTTYFAGVHKSFPEVLLLKMVHQMSSAPFLVTANSAFKNSQLPTTALFTFVFADDEVFQVFPVLHITGVHFTNFRGEGIFLSLLGRDMFQPRVPLQRLSVMSFERAFFAIIYSLLP